MSKTALITGATSGIGYELSKVFAKNRYNLVIVSRNSEKLDAVAGELRQLHGIQVKVISKDLCKFTEPQELYDEISADNIVIDVLVNNAGAGIHGRVVDLSAAKHMDLIQLNIASLTILCRLFPESVWYFWAIFLSQISATTDIDNPILVREYY